MKINVICVGKIKEKFFSMAIDEYSKRLSKYCDLTIIEVDDEKTPDNSSRITEDNIMKIEAERISKHIKQGTYVITLEIEGNMPDSVTLSDKLANLSVNGYSVVNFIIGGSLGLHDSIKKIANYKLSFSKMTFPHQLMRVILLEQIYRSYRIQKGEPYHK